MADNALYVFQNGVKHYVKSSPAPRLEFSEHPRDAVTFADQATAATYLAARPTTLVVLGGTGTAALAVAHAGKKYADRSE